VFGKRSNQPRTAEDRARAAAERAARRAGRPLPVEAFEHSIRPPDIEPREPLTPVEEEPAREEAPRREEAAPPPEVAREEAPPAAEPPREEPAPPPVVPREEAPRREEAAPPREEMPEPRAEAAPPPEVVREEAPAEVPEPRAEAASPREEAPPPASRADDTAARDITGNGRSRDDLVHQPTVEYTPFQTEEHQVPEAPLGAPQEDEPRLVAARNVARPQREETAEQEEVPVAPLRRAPAQPKNAARRRPAPNAPRGRARRSRATKMPKSSRPTGQGHWGRRIFAVVALLVILGALYVVNATFQPFHGDGEGRVAVTIPENSDAGEIGAILADKGVVDNARFFELNATLSGDRGNLRPGRYTLQRGMKNAAVIDVLTKVPEAPKQAETVTVTLVEGPSRKENAPVVDGSGKVEGSYAKASASKATLKRIRELGAPKGTKTAEGFLFPATYELEVGATAADLVEKQLDAFEENFKKVDLKKAKRANLTRYDVLIIASMIEREASVPRERRLVAAVIYNRLKEGMPLGIDATTRYSTNNWKRPIRQSELDRDEPYNTRIRRGLPPTPIGNPGLASIKAAANPANRDYLYYVQKPGKSGEHAFSSTDAEFQRDYERYHADRNGG